MLYLVLIVTIASLLRLLLLGSLPPALTWDEVSWGYNAFSLLTTGADEFGVKFPITFLESFGDYKPPLYAYLDIIPIALFGLTEFAVRLPSAVFGIITVILTYFLSIEIFYSSKQRNKIALLSSLVLAISPWHILLSRAAFEANVATAFITAGVYLFLRAIRTNKWLLIASVLCFTLSMYTFNTARIVSPLLGVLLTLTHLKTILNSAKKEFITACVIAGVLLIPLALFLTTPQAQLRYQEVNIFSDLSISERINTQIQNDDNSTISRIIHNRRLVYPIEYLDHYFHNLSPNFLFVSGDGNPKFSTQDVGQMYMWEIPFFLGGMFLLFRRKEGKWWLIPVWMVLAIAPAATARETPHALRIESALPTFQIVTAYALVKIFSSIKDKALKIMIIPICVVVALLNFFYFFHNYTTHYAREYSGEWQYGYKQAIHFVKEEEKNYDKIYVTKELGRPYIYTLFYTSTSPKKFQQDSDISREVFGFVNVDRVGKYHFVKDVSDHHNSAQKSLYVSVPGDVPENANVREEVKLLNGKTALVIYTL